MNYWKRFCWRCCTIWFSANTGCNAEVKVFDKNPNRSQNSLDEVVNDSDFIFYLFLHLQT